MWLNHANNGAHYFSQVIDLIDFICGRNARFVARRQVYSHKKGRRYYLINKK
jgi:hypothetical protein